MDTSSPDFSLIILILVGLLGITSIGAFLSFGPPSKKLDDPFDDHDD